MDCVWKDSCQKLYKLRDMCGPDNTNSERPVDIFDIIIKKCSLKNYDRSYIKDGSNEGMYYCPDCNAMHHGYSRVGKLHKKVM